MAEKIIIQPEQMHSLSLAFLGDAVFELAVRQRIFQKGIVKLHQLNKETVRYVRADAQAKLVFLIEPFLTEEEADVLRRGRNAKSRHFSRGSSVVEYRHATALEALMGYLFVQNRQQRIDELVDIMMAESEVTEV